MRKEDCNLQDKCSMKECPPGCDNPENRLVISDVWSYNDEQLNKLALKILEVKNDNLEKATTR